MTITEGVVTPISFALIVKLLVVMFNPSVTFVIAFINTFANIDAFPRFETTSVTRVRVRV